jgi:hypothetical protein
MNHIRGVCGIEDKDHLQPSSAVTPTDDPPFALFSQLWVRRAGVLHNPLRLLGRDPVFGDVINIPLVPSEQHRRPPECILPYGKIIIHRGKEFGALPAHTAGKPACYTANP